MPRLVKGAKWAYGWVVVGPQGRLPIPEEAWREFGFLPGTEAVFLPGSRRSGGFSISTPDLMAVVSRRMEGSELSVLGCSTFGEDRCVILPDQVVTRPGDRLLVVHGSRYGLGFVACGPIFEEAKKHPGDLQVFGRRRRIPRKGSCEADEAGGARGPCASGCPVGSGAHPVLTVDRNLGQPATLTKVRKYLSIWPAGVGDGQNDAHPGLLCGSPWQVVLQRGCLTAADGQKRFRDISGAHDPSSCVRQGASRKWKRKKCCSSAPATRLAARWPKPS